MWPRARACPNLHSSSLRTASWRRYLASNSAIIRFVAYVRNTSSYIQGVVSRPKSQRQHLANCTLLRRSSYERTSLPLMTFTRTFPQRTMTWRTRVTWLPSTRALTMHKVSQLALAAPLESSSQPTRFAHPVPEAKKPLPDPSPGTL